MKEVPLISTSELSIGYKHRNKEPTIVSKNLNLSLMPGELVCLIGPNGAGKSTLIRTLIGMQSCISGDIHLAGKLLNDFNAIEKARVLSVVLTSQISVSHFKASDIVALGRYPYTGWSGTLSEKDKEMVSYSLTAVGASELSSRYVSELSDGEKQKVMIARGLAQDPSVLVLDEPTAFLDLPHKIEIMRILKSLSRHPGRAVLLSIHDLDIAMRTADKIWLFNKHGDFYSGAPEDLILKGVFGSAFEMGGVHFDKKKGTFIISPEKKGTVSLIGGNNTEFIWTSHALERAGYNICTDTNTDITIEIQDRKGDTCWQYMDNTCEHDFFSIGDMIQFLCKGHKNSVDQQRSSDELMYLEFGKRTFPEVQRTW
ncbi:ABC transporter ATP-binding protein [Methanolobus profundi]|uniref:Iron complex transport system ATP-binding protein n=1 Tax=Methanolobus profundi TaxID=487685 RepID=A0A1I4PH72_9EURY|nr:ABC transporter ATP-binding protein [Methanolobus profundi]SFM27024.1 iron complex transport system ATP-binding protein [Methanolobus profundi]